jgi:hypothetical protein
MTPDELVLEVIESKFLAKFCHKFAPKFMDFDDWQSEVMLATVKASKRWVAEKGSWHTFVFWAWRSVRSEVYRQYRQRLKLGTVVSLDRLSKVDNLKFDLADTKQSRMTIEASLIEKLVDSLSDREKKFLLGASNAEVSAMGLTRSKYEVEKRRVRRKLAELIP